MDHPVTADDLRMAATNEATSDDPQTIFGDAEGLTPGLRTHQTAPGVPDRHLSQVVVSQVSSSGVVDYRAAPGVSERAT